MNFSSIFAEPGTEHNTWCLTFWVLQVKLLRLSALSPWLCPYFPVFFSLSPHVCRSVCLQVCRSVFLESLPGLLCLAVSLSLLCPCLSRALWAFSRPLPPSPPGAAWGPRPACPGSSPPPHLYSPLAPGPEGKSLTNPPACLPGGSGMMLLDETPVRGCLVFVKCHK